MKSAAQVGLLVVVAAVLLFVGLSVVGSGLFKPKTDQYTVEMPDAGGLGRGSQVLMAGVPVGEVSEVGLAGPRQARLTIQIKQGTALPTGTRANVPTSLVGLGDSPLELVPPAEGGAGTLAVGSVIPGGKAGPLDNILPNGGTELYANLNKTLQAVQALLADQGMKKDVRGLLVTTKATLETSQSTLRAFAAIAQRGDRLLAREQGQIDAIVRTTERTLTAVAGTAETLEAYAKGGKLQKGANQLIADAHGIAVEARGLIADMHKTIADPQLQANLQNTLGNVSKASNDFPGLVSEAKRATTNVADLTEKSQDLPGKLGNVLDKAADLEDRLGGLVGKVGGVLGAKPKGLPPLTTSLDLIRETNPGYWRTDLNLSFPITDGFVTAGLWDAFGRDRLNLQLGKNVSSKFDYRYGIYGGKPGVGVDYALTSKLGFRGDLWDINEPRLDARLRYDFGGGLNGWMGVDRIFRGGAFTFGIGIRR